MAIKKVALAGATGALGAPMLQALLEAGFNVTVLTRPTSTHTFPGNVQVKKVEYHDLESLKSALAGQEALISTITTSAIDQQKLLIDAAIAANVQRIIPSEFGCDLENAKARALPVYADKVELEQYIQTRCRQQSDDEGKTTYTFVFNNAFFDWGLDAKFLVDAAGRKMEIYDGGNQPFTTTTLAQVAQGTVGVLQHLEQTANRSVRLHGTGLTQKRLLEIAKRVVGGEGWEVTESDCETIRKGSYANFEKEPANWLGWGLGFLKVAIYGEGFGGDFREKNDNALLGVTELDEKAVEELIRARA
ncbi:hypothetical protein KC343_g16241 [Hortaea werneckii]|uniref:NmrA-like domain-containing protein n=1 Tax=Hortaea werneckii TaxID=91943 RepID=A0A3M7DX06_HORWE|nr:hypothetical protein KC352_g26452 [Hortaea werneckii]KAI7549146.1 hypothetical protein KC317_g14651 [Hortaea werneckii]KAI7594663.1 hypothetical protein KC346_g15576 [Hortaea werneckii]KAI7598831.1 hypothetical protein KC343_g16241 [Hortaea werneckii]KAI7626065.1 hypothetical protein KC319_g17596 [Hortaea werneckii]